MITAQLLRRTFEASKYERGTEERERFNLDPLTSEYYTGSPYTLHYSFIGPDGKPQWINNLFRLKSQAFKYAEEHNIIILSSEH